MGYYLYILESEENGRYYVGISDDPKRRVKHHNSTSTGFTSRYRPWQLVFSHEYRLKEEAQEAERQIKDWKSRTMTEYVIEGEIAPAELVE